MNATATTYRIGTDIGGTFTDIVLLGDDGFCAVKKALSTPPHYETAIVRGIRELLDEHGIAPGQLTQVAHATTVATNAVLERRGAKTGLITTRGFRDVLELRRMRFPDMYNLFWEKPLPIVERYLRREVDERLAADGTVLRPLDAGEAERAVARLVDGEGIEALAVCLLHAYANPAHEEAIGEVAARRHPGLAVSLSSSVLPEIKEYERTSTTALNSYLMPVVETYLDTLERDLRALGVTAPIVVMRSSGGTMTVRAAAAGPVHILESGPAAGVVGAAVALSSLGIADGVTFDMGGTTAKSAMIENGEPMHVSEYEVGAPISIASRVLKGGGYLLRAPTIDVAEIGAGGGSIVHIDEGGALRVGPRSAGASPGPACYGKGGAEPTVTDANVVLGYLNPRALLGGRLPVDAERARAALSAVAETISLPLEETAFGVCEIANATMTRAIRAVSTERGRDVRDCTLVVFGGNGAVHAAAIARALDIRRVLVPAFPGVFSAAGLLCAPIEHHLSESTGAGGASPRDVEAGLARLEHRVRRDLEDEGWRGRPVDIARFAELRYRGQSHELRVAVAGPLDSEAGYRRLMEDFETEHRRTYGHAHTRDEVELSTIRVRGRVELAPPALPRGGAKSAGAGAARPAYFGPAAGMLETPVIGRSDLAGGMDGPLIVEEYDTTIVVPPGCRARSDAAGNVFIELEG